MNEHLLAALGEENEFSERVLVPDSYYPTVLGVLEVAVTDRKAWTPPDGGPEVEAGYLPYVRLSSNIDDGPFAGANIVRNYFINAGSVKNLKGGKIQLLNGACYAITGQHVAFDVLPQFGIVLPTSPDAGEEARAFQTRVRRLFAEGFVALDPARRLETYRMTDENGMPAFDSQGNERYGSSNDVAGFYPLSHEKYSLAYVTRIEFPKQQRELDRVTTERM